MAPEIVFPTGRVRVTNPLKARSIETGERVWFPRGTLLWHVEINDESVRFQEIGGRGQYEVPKYDFMPCVRKMYR